VGYSKVIAFGKGYGGRRARHGDSMPVAPVKMIVRELAKRARVVMTHGLDIHVYQPWFRDYLCRPNRNESEDSVPGVPQGS